jgi:hypothetical protein
MEAKSPHQAARGSAWTAEFWSADHKAKWAIGSSGAIARYTPATSWALQSSGVTNDLVAGSARSIDICWVVGRDGVILRTVDGEHWEKLQSPIKSDVTRVAAESATSATVTARDGRRFLTSDGGVSWRPL